MLADAKIPSGGKPAASADLQEKTEEVAKVLAALSNPRRLQLLCNLIRDGETNVSALAESVDLSQSALSQHLALMRAEGLVRSRREGLNVFYSISDPRTRELVGALEKIYCTS